LIRWSLVDWLALYVTLQHAGPGPIQVEQQLWFISGEDNSCHCNNKETGKAGGVASLVVCELQQ